VQGASLISFVVNKAGVPEHIQIVKPVGMGLDDQAVESVKNWRFTPGTLSGEPVAVFTSAEVRFALY
jgi:TonB family protein